MPTARPPTPLAVEIAIYGGTSGGVAAAVQARRMGKTVALIEPGRHLGGMTSGGLSAVDIGDPRTVGGIAREFFTRRAGDHPALAGCARFGRPRLWLAPFSRSGLYNPEERRRQSRVHDHRPEGRVAPFR